MIILDKPYVSPEMKEYLGVWKHPVLRNETSISENQGAGLNLVTPEEFIGGYEPGHRIYTVSENSLDWIYRHVPDEELIRCIDLMKDKVKFREMMGDLYPDFFYREVGISALADVDFEELNLPFILKPSVGFFSVGVYTITSRKDWNLAVAEILENAREWGKSFPDKVVGNSTFILEEYIDGEEYAIDAYYDEAGKPVILNIMKHDFSSISDVSDRLYYTSKEIIEEKLTVFTDFLEEANRHIGARNFPMHAEVRVSGARIMPIEFNPMRFAGWCCTDLAYFAFGLRTYVYYLKNEKPDWETLLAGKENKLFTLIVLDKPEGFRSGNAFDYPKVCASFKKVLHLRRLDYEKQPVFGFLFTETDAADREELDRIMKSDLLEYQLGPVKAVKPVGAVDVVNALDAERKTMNTAELFVKCLEEEEVEYIFGIPGEETLDLMNAIEESEKIQFITTRHEQGAAFMADVYGRLTGKAGVCLATLGPGATNLVTGVADANLDGAPLVAITGQVGTDKMHITAHQYLDLTKMFEPITKRTKMIVRPDTVPEITRIAFKYAEGLKPGATHIDLPTNIAKMEAPGVPLKKKVPHAGFATAESIEMAAALISKAENPVIIVGADAVHADASDALTLLANMLKIPVVNTMMAKGMVSFENEYSMWTIGIPQRDYINQLFDKADMVITVGYDIVELNPSKWNRKNLLDIVHIGYETAHVNKYYQPKVEVVGDLRSSLNQMLIRAKRNSVPEFALALRAKIKAEHESYAGDTSFPMKPQRIINDIQKVLGKDDILISDVGAHKMWIARHYNCQKPNTCIISNGFASMGIAIPGAVAAKLVNPERKVLAVTGDGGFMMNSQELETACRIGTPFVTLIMNDESYGLIKWKQMEQFGRSAYVDFTNPDFVLYAEAMHCKGYRIEKAEDLVPTLIEAFKQTVPAIIDCRIDYDENIRLTERLSRLEEASVL